MDFKKVTMLHETEKKQLDFIVKITLLWFIWIMILLIVALFSCFVH